MDRDSPSRPPRIGQDGARARTLAAAHQLFTKNGYRATTTKQISVRAGVAEPTLFRNFGSKAELFEATILEPFTQFIAGWTSSWHELSVEAPLPDIAENLVAGLFKLVREDRLLLRELIAARWDSQSDLHSSAVTISTQVRDGLRAVHDVGLDIAEKLGLAGLDAPATIAAVTSMVMGSVLLDDWVVPLGVRAPSQARMIREIASLVTDGIAHRTK